MRQAVRQGFSGDLLERAPELRLVPAFILWNWLKRHKNGAIGQVSPGNYILDTVQYCWPRGVKQYFILIRA